MDTEANGNHQYISQQLKWTLQHTSVHHWVLLRVKVHTQDYNRNVGSHVCVFHWVLLGTPSNPFAHMQMHDFITYHLETWYMTTLTQISRLCNQLQDIKDSTWVQWQLHLHHMFEYPWETLKSPKNCMKKVHSTRISVQQTQRFINPLPVTSFQAPRSYISTSNNLDALSRAFAWHICAILVHHMKGFENYKSNLSLPEEVDKLPVEQTTQYPANAINTDEGQNDGNWEVLKNLLQQVNPRHPTH